MYRSKGELLARMRDAIALLRETKTPGGQLNSRIAFLEVDLEQMAEDVAQQIDDYQAGLYERHNLKRPHFDVNGLSGRWTNDSRRKHGRC